MISPQAYSPAIFRKQGNGILAAMNGRKHIRVIRAVQRVVAAAKELADAERALKKRPRRRPPRQATQETPVDQSRQEGGTP